MAGEGLRLSPQPRLPALTHCMDGKREGGEAPKQDMQEYQHNLGKDTCTHRLHKDRDEVMAGTRLEVRPQDVQRHSQHLIQWESCSGKELWKGRLLQLQFELTPG